MIKSNELELYGSIGYTYLRNNICNKDIIIFADMHDILPECKNNYINIKDLLISKFNTSKIFLEEIPSYEHLKKYSGLIELWSNSKHTQDIKNLYLKYQDIIEGIDIRYYLIPFNIEIINNNNLNTQIKKIKLSEYIKDLYDFFYFKKNISKMSYFNYYILNSHILCIKNILFSNPSKSIISHFNKIKNKFLDFINSNNDLLDKTIFDIYNNKSGFFILLDEIIDDCMEWYCCYLIDIYNLPKIIIHAGLFHTSKINDLLFKYYDYENIESIGIVKISQGVEDNVDLSCKKISLKLSNF